MPDTFQYARMWPREVFDVLIPVEGRQKQLLARAPELKFLANPGVYILYRDEVPYYVGQAKKLRGRLWQHANVPGARYYNFWNFFSAFVVADPKERDRLEGILIASMPTANGVKPRLPKEKLPAVVRDLMRELRQRKVKLSA